ncbi:probable lipid-A-disaccharide synthase, mitochondrial [Prosopis cineraria]|uniref:probable lipid-A-disaccharide synthase, mitochondrial n=1 Tax=Prosopis cineraria TaxID=364024 RepID=UPI002410298E|nr:probable lipid-A-disaccharide synthase, mitochondrial [Prosopis cineraria]
MLGANIGRRKLNWKSLNVLGLWILQRKQSIASVSSSSSTAKAPLDMAAKDGELRVFIVAGEVSGDSIASRLMASLKNLCPFPVRFAGVGGHKMSSEGLKSSFPMEDISVMGIWELLPYLYTIRVKLKEIVEAAAKFDPHVVLTVDSKGFSFRFLKQLRARHNQKKLPSPVHFHYVAPSFWAWKGGEARLPGLAEFVDHLLCILPNEAEICKLNGLAATFVGHPMIEDILELNLRNKSPALELRAEGSGEDFCSKHAVPSEATVISVLPGSRVQEVTRMLPIFASTVELLKETFPQLMTVIHVASNLHVENYIAAAVHKWPVPVILIPGGSTNLKYDAFSASRVALCTSGTAALELQLARLPCVVAYRAHILTEWFIRCKAKIQYISLPNILLNSAIIPEALFQSCSPGNLASLLKNLMHDNRCREEQIVAAEKVFKLLCPSERIVHNFSQGSLINLDYTPSIVAALTILNHGRQNSVID